MYSVLLSQRDLNSKPGTLTKTMFLGLRPSIPSRGCPLLQSATRKEEKRGSLDAANAYTQEYLSSKEE